MEALVVGINYYPSHTTLQQLTAAANDAEGIALHLEQSGYQTVRVQRLPRQANQKGEWQIDPNEGVKIQEFQEAISNLLIPPDGNPPETVLVFFSGHGWRKNVNGKEEVFLATSDIWPSESIYGMAISWLGNLIQNSPIKKLIIWLDCCYSGELIEYLPTNKDYCIFTATRSYELGIEIRHQEGLFTQALKEGLNPDNDPDGWVDSHKLAKYIQKRMAQTGQAPQCFNSERSILLTSKVTRTTFKNECPYRSLAYFTERPEDAQVFYGRTKLTQDLVKLVRDKERLIAVFGASGSGKSSLLRAGLLYQLKLGQEIAGSNNWVYVKPFTPTDDPVTKLQEALGEINLSLPSTNDATHQSPHQLSMGNEDDRTPIILIIDQFEECFTMCDEEQRQIFIDRLMESIDRTPNLQLIIGMRSDFRGRLREYDRFARQMHKVNVEHLNREEIQEAIEKPADFVGLGIEGSLKQQLINDVEDYPGSLPLLQYTLTELWLESRKQGEQFLRLETYRGLGGIEGTLEKRADAVYASLDPEEQKVAQRIFLELTQIGDSFDTRRRVRLGDLVNSYHTLEILEQVTQTLANQKNRLITRTGGEKAEDESSKITIEVVHEALIRHWELLRQWREKYQAAMAIERKIEAAAQEWAENGKKTEDLLSGSRLGEAEESETVFSKLGMLDGMAEDFIKQSHRSRERLEQEQDNRNKREIRAARGIAAGALVTILVTSGLSLMTWNKTQEAEVSQANSLGHYSQSLRSGGKELNAFIQAIKAGKTLQHKHHEVINDDAARPVVMNALKEAIYKRSERNRLEGHDSGVNSVSFSPDGKTLASGSNDKTIKLWNVMTGKELTTLTAGLIY
jgi:energy-coupling factor transporter ATP-binding protein EcfA2